MYGWWYFFISLFLLMMMIIILFLWFHMIYIILWSRAGDFMIWIVHNYHFIEWFYAVMCHSYVISCVSLFHDVYYMSFSGWYVIQSTNLIYFDLNIVQVNILSYFKTWKLSGDGEFICLFMFLLYFSLLWCLLCLLIMFFKIYMSLV